MDEPDADAASPPSQPEAARTGRPPTVLVRALSLLSAFDERNLVLSLPQLAIRTGLPQSTAHRHLRDLVSWGALDRVAGGYQIGLRLVEIASLCPRGAELRRVALPYLEDLYEATRQNVQLAVRDGLEVVVVEFIAGRDAVKVRTRVGARWPLHATGVGLALLAHAPRDVLERLLAAPMAVYTPRTMRTPAQVRQAVADVRRKGFAVSDGQVIVDGYSVAAPVFGRDGQVAAAVSVVVPSDDQRRAMWAPAVCTAAHGIGRALGPQSPRR